MIFTENLVLQTFSSMQELKTMLRTQTLSGNEIGRIGLVENPLIFGSSQLISKASSLCTSFDWRYSSTKFTADSLITQTTGTGVTAVGKVVSYDQPQVF